MIEAIVAGEAAAALGGISSGMAGLDIATAYNEHIDNQYELFDDEYEQYIGYSTKTTVKPSVNGDQEDVANSIVNSSASDPLIGYNDYVTVELGQVSEETGGALIGSKVDTINYSLMENPDLSVSAVEPVGVPLTEAYPAIAKALGVAMKYEEISPALAGAMEGAILTSGYVYKRAEDLVACWWDGANILFPKKVVESVNDVLIEEGIGDEETSEDFPGTVVPTSSVASYADGEHELRAWGAIFAREFGGRIVACSTAPGTYHEEAWSTPGPQVHVYEYNLNYHAVINNKDVYYKYISAVHNVTNSPAMAYGTTVGAAQVAYIALYGDAEFPPGTYRSRAPRYTPAQMVELGQVAGPGAAPGSISKTPVVAVNVPDNTRDTTETTYDPVTTPTTDEKVDSFPFPPIPLPIPNTGTANPDVSIVDSTVINYDLVNELVSDLATTVDPAPVPSTGIVPFPFMPGVPIDPSDPSAGSTFPSYVPSSGSGLIHVYNPTSTEFINFGKWLWVTYADTSIDKIWNNPFDGIIGAFELYATPLVSGRDNIRSGFLVCPTQSDVVSDRYIELDCGSVIVPEFYGNYLDYSPYSQAYIYLPFIGINEVSIDDIVGHCVNIRYRVDTYNGSCIAMIYVAKSGYRNLVYQFAGSCSVEVPLAGGSQAAIKAGILQAEAYARSTVQSAQIQKAASIGSGVASGARGNSVAGMITGSIAGGVAGYIQGDANYGAAKLQAGAQVEAARYANKSSVQHSGEFGASHGAMGLKKPFIMLRSPIQVKVPNYNQEYGFPAHKRVIIGGCRGYLRVQEVNVVSAHATNEEKIAIEEALKAGVYVT